MNGRVPQPIPYQGSKRQIAPIIVSYFPSHVIRLVEPFAGSAALSIAVAIRKLANTFWINDAHEPLIALWKEILERPEGIARHYETLWNEQRGQEKTYFNKVRERFNQTHEPVDFLYLLARCVKAAIRYNANGEFNNTPDNRRRGARPLEMRWRIACVAELLASKTSLTALDYKKVLAQSSESDLVYMDPPYQGVCGDRDQRYAPRIDHAEFCEELARLNARNIMYAVSYDGRTGDKVYGKPLPKRLSLTHIEIEAGRSSQATLLGRNHVTVESLYLSPALVEKQEKQEDRPNRQLTFA